MLNNISWHRDLPRLFLSLCLLHVGVGKSCMVAKIINIISAIPVDWQPYCAYSHHVLPEPTPTRYHGHTDMDHWH